MRAAIGLLVALVAAAGPGLAPSQQALQTDVAALADDVMAGRRVGTVGYDRAADYVVARFRAIGLSPLAGQDWRQSVPLVTLHPADPGIATLIQGHHRHTLGPDDIALSLPERPEDEQVSGIVVAAGHCVVNKAAGMDDFARIDVHGRIAACVAGAPASLSASARAVHGAPLEQARAAHARGALGIIVVQAKAQAEGTSFARIARAWRVPRTILAEPSDEGRVLALLSAGGAERLFASATPSLLTLSASARRDRLTSDNVIGWLPGTDPRLRHNPVVLSAHLDHLGDDVPPAFGSNDRIANGALDNAIGVATMIAVAERMTKTAARPARGVIFVAFTGEEQGLLGSSWFVRHPPVAHMRPVVNVNIDMPILTYDLHDLVVLGSGRSCLATLVHAAAAASGLPVVADPAEEAALPRSDQYSFLRAGITAILPLPGPGGEGATATKAFMAQHYHRPNDDMKQSINWRAADRYVDFVHRLTSLLTLLKPHACRKG